MAAQPGDDSSPGASHGASHSSHECFHVSNHDSNSDSNQGSSQGGSSQGSSSQGGAGQAAFQPVKASFAVLYLVCFVEGADCQLLPASFRALEVGMGLSPTSLAAMGLCQALAQSMSSPIWGVLVDRGCSGKALVLMGTLGWSVVTLALACVRDLWSMLALRMLNGLALATLSPVVQAIIADLAPPQERGRHFGWCGFAANMGNVVCAAFTTAISNQQVRDIPGWRVAFGVVAVAGFLLALLISVGLQEHRKREFRPCSLAGEVAATLRCFRSSSFGVIVLQGCFGSIPWSALAFLTMFFQYGGLTDAVAGSLMSLSMMASAVGQVLGGHVGDWLAAWSPHHGRVFAAQFSSLVGVPIIFSLLHWVPRGPPGLPLYVALTTAFGLLASWCGNGVNRPLLTEVVPPSSRARVVTLLAALEGSAAACLGAPLVGLLAERAFQYQPETRPVEDMPASVREQNLGALAAAMLYMTTLPWLACFASYSLLHVTYKRDLERIHRESSETQPLVAK